MGGRIAAIPVSEFERLCRRLGKSLGGVEVDGRPLKLRLQVADKSFFPTINLVVAAF